MNNKDKEIVINNLDKELEFLEEEINANINSEKYFLEQIQETETEIENLLKIIEKKDEEVIYIY